METPELYVRNQNEWLLSSERASLSSASPQSDGLNLAIVGIDK